MIAIAGRANRRSHRPRHLAPSDLERHLNRRRAQALRRAAAGTVAALATTATTTAVLTFDDGPVRTPAAAPVVPAEVDPSCPTTTALARRAAEVLVVGLPGVTDADDALVGELAELGVGGVMLRDANLRSRRQATELVAGLRTRLGADLLVAVDEEGGRVTSLRALGGTHRSARRLGAAGPEAARDAGDELGELAAALDIDLVLGPVVDLDDGPWDGVIGDRSFGGDAHDVAEVAGAYAAGIRAHGVAVTLKHFPGHGRADSEPHAGTTADHRLLHDLVRDDLVPYDALMADGAEAVMLGHVIYPEIWGRVPATLVPGPYELLRDRGFTGVAMTDALGMGAVYNEWGFDRSPAMALAAGADALLVTQGDRARELVDGVVAAVDRGDLDEGRLDEAVARVARLRGSDPTGLLCA